METFEKWSAADCVVCTSSLSHCSFAFYEKSISTTLGQICCVVAGTAEEGCGAAVPNLRVGSRVVMKNMLVLAVSSKLTEEPADSACCQILQLY